MPPNRLNCKGFPAGEGDVSGLLYGKLQFCSNVLRPQLERTPREERAMANRSRVPTLLAPIFLLAANIGAVFSVAWLLEELWFSTTAHITLGVVRGLTKPEIAHEGRRAVVQFQVG